MSAEMRDFAAAFNKGLDRGVGMYDKSQERAIQKEHNKLLRDQHEAQERNADRRTDIYAQSVTSAAETNRIKAQAALNKGAGRGGGVAAPAPNPDKYAEGAAGVGLAIPKPQAPPVPTVINQTFQSTSDDAPAMPIPPPDGMKKGGMVRKYADGGMTVSEALAYGPRAGKPATPEDPASAFTKNFTSAYEKSKAAADKAEAARKVKAEETKRIRDAAAPATTIPSTPAPAATGPPTALDPNALGPDPNLARGSDAEPSASYTSDTSSGGVSAGYGGDGSSGGTAAYGGETYRRGGRVRRFQSGGRVMEAIDTGTSGPGSGYGYRAAPPSRRY